MLYEAKQKRISVSLHYFTSNMKERRQPCELTQRRQISSRFNELKANCEHLASKKDELSHKLSELNRILDQLITEKSTKKHASNVKNQSIIPSKSCNDDEQPPSLAVETHVSFNPLQSQVQQKLYSSSNAFKTKLLHCLEEISPKAEEIVKLSEQLYQTKFPNQ